MKRSVFAVISFFAFLIAMAISSKPTTGPIPKMTTTTAATTATTTIATTVTTATIDLSGFDFNKPAVEYAGPLNAADRMLVATVVEMMGGGNESAQRQIVDILYNRHVAPTEWFGESINAIISKPDQFIYDPEHEPSETTLDLVDDEMQRILNGAPLVPEGYCFFFIEESDNARNLVPFKYKNGWLGEPGDEIITYQI